MFEANHSHICALLFPKIPLDAFGKYATSCRNVLLRIFKNDDFLKKKDYH